MTKEFSYKCRRALPALDDADGPSAPKQQKVNAAAVDAPRQCVTQKCGGRFKVVVEEDKSNPCVLGYRIRVEVTHPK